MFERIVLFLKDKLTPPPYKLEGECLKCGQCCRLMYSLDSYTPYEFKITQLLFPSYRRFEIVGKDEEGNLMFRCKWVTEKNICLHYNKRLKMCKNFPNVRYGSLGKVPKGCGYRLVPINKFQDILEQEQQGTLN